jgi:anti-sigma factor RsiW
MARHEAQALWAYAAGELDVETRTRVEAHVAGCAPCAQQLEEVRQARAVLQAARPEAPAVDWARVDERVLGAATRQFARLERTPRWPWAVALVGAACAAVLAFVLLRPVAPPAQVPAPVVARTEVPAPPAPAPVQEVARIQVESATEAWGHEGGGAEQALKAGGQLRPGASVRTPAKASALLRLPDASRVRVSPESEVVLSRAEARDVHLTVKRGRLAVQASHAERRGFVVQAAGVRVAVVGTVFSVEQAARGVTVAVLEGKVRVEAEGQPPRLVSAGERVELREGEPTVRPRPLSAQDRQAFLALGVTSTPPVPLLRPPAPKAPASSVQPPMPEVQEPSAVASTEASTPPAEAPPSPAVPPEPVVQRPMAPSPAGVGDTFVPPPEWAPGKAGMPLSRDSEERFLRHARAQLSASTCESFLAGLAELAERSTVREFREQARYLRARCFEERLAPEAAAAEYRLYLREHPRGRYADEARTALLP